MDKKGLSALFTDYYAITMSQGHWKHNHQRQAVFEMSFRRQPFGGGYTVFAGLGTLLENLAAFSFADDDLEYIKSLGGFEDDFLDYLKNFRFSGSLWAVDEGTVVFPQEPLIRISGNLIECQLIEAMLLNTINFQSLIATKTRRVWHASGKGSIMEFGLRRAQGPDGALSASRASFIGGAIGTSNTMAGKAYGIPVMGTMGHSWVMSFHNEEESFDAYAGLYPERTVFLIDTYDTIKYGVINAIKAGAKLNEQGKKFGVRLDSGDIEYLSVQVRKMLDDAGFNDASITVSNELDETIIETLVRLGAPVDTWGVGTNMVTGGNDAALTGVYKMAACEDKNGVMTPVMKFSDNPEKTTNPGVKQVWRLRDEQNSPVADILAMDGPDEVETLQLGSKLCFWHTSGDYRHFFHEIGVEPQPLLKPRLNKGARVGGRLSLAEIRSFSGQELETFNSTYKRLLNPHIYKVSMTEKLRNLKLELINSFVNNM
jgi:nicotinate phosphoribosyltransferase